MPNAPRNAQRTVRVEVGGSCPSRGPLGGCECGTSDIATVEAQLRGGGRTATLIGDPVNNVLAARAAALALEEGFAEVRAQTCGHSIRSDADARALADTGASAAVFPILSHDPRVHDRIAGRDGALVQTLFAMRAAARAGLAIDIEVPLLPPRLQNLSEIISLAHRTVSALRNARFLVPGGELPEPLQLPGWDTMRPALAEALRTCAELEVATTLRAVDGIPLCALAPYPEFARAIQFDPRSAARRRPDFGKADACRECAAKRQCPGVPLAGLARFGGRGLLPWARRPRELYEQRTTPGRVWTDEQREAARKTNFLVLRPTVNCNQDCPFCSANESSNNIWAEAIAMRKQIARAAQRGLLRVSFSGGEPALSPHLASYVRVASRCGIEYIELVTNGALLARKDRAQEIIDAGLTDAFVSLHGHTELLSRTMTQKVGDFDKTVRAIHHFLDGGVRVVLNHVIGTRNYRYLEQYVEFVHREFGGRAGVSFAFMTPQFKALANVHLVPRMSDVGPYLKRALYRAIDLGQPVHIGSRQGIPPCILGEFTAWSDALQLGAAAISEDQPQKQRGPDCDSCRYTRQCTGLWKPYVAMYGLDELEPIPGDPFSDEEAARLSNIRYASGYHYPGSFDEVPERLRNPNAPPSGPPEIEPLAPPALDGYRPLRSRPLRVVVLGTGRQARRLALASRGLESFAIDAVASPHAPDAVLTEFSGALTYRDPELALDEVQPDAVVIAAATHAHHALVELAAARDLPVLVEKPLARTVEEAEGLAELERTGKARVMMAHNVLFAPGLDVARGLVGEVSSVRITVRAGAAAPSTPKSWEHESLFETLHHSVALATWLAGGTSVPAIRAQFRGDSSPEWIRATLEFGEAVVELNLDYRSRVDEQLVQLESDGSTASWSRVNQSFAVALDDDPVSFERDGGEHARMLRAFADAARGDAPYPATAVDGLNVMKATLRLLDALREAGAPMSRASAPRHVASKAMIPTGRTAGHR